MMIQLPQEIAPRQLIEQFKLGKQLSDEATKYLNTCTIAKFNPSTEELKRQLPPKDRFGSFLLASTQP